MIATAAVLLLMCGIVIIDASSSDLKHVTLYNNGESHGGVPHMVRREDFANGRFSKGTQTDHIVLK
jgi:hypothetical protein